MVWGGLRDLEYGLAKYGINMCFIIVINSQYVSDMHVNKQQVSSVNWSLN